MHKYYIYLLTIQSTTSYYSNKILLNVNKIKHNILKSKIIIITQFHKIPRKNHF